jgi:hypothetical protein
VPITQRFLRGAPRTALLLALPLLADTALAQGTDEQRIACTPDVMRLCAADIPNVDRITSCLVRQRASVSSACRTAMRDPGDAIEVASTGSVRRRVAP